MEHPLQQKRKNTVGWTIEQQAMLNRVEQPKKDNKLSQGPFRDAYNTPMRMPPP